MAAPSRAPMPRRRTLVGSHPMCTAQSMEDLYASGDVIGTGSFGIIRKVTRRADGKILARKELNYGRMDERDLKQLTEEVNVLEQLKSNDNIVRYIERFVDKPENMLYIIMEYCEGGDLAGVIQRCRKTGCLLPEDVVWAYLTQITLALHDCHSEVDRTGQRKTVILHRDLKPENVFLDKDNNLKLGDFGLSKAMQQAAMTQTYVGTPYYMSPELINGQLYDVKSDIWALGCLIYELCAGHPPFHEARTQPELAVMIREGKIPDLPKPYSAHLGQVVKAMLQQNPKRRPNTAQIKTLDTVKMQVRALELRKASRELRLRDAHVAEREKDLLERESAVLARESAVLARENAVRAAQEAVKENEGKLANAWAAHRAQVYQHQHQHQQQQQQGYTLGPGRGQVQERENVRPVSTGAVEPEVIARVASRPSMVPRRPLGDDRRISNAGSLAFPRVSSSSSLMSLDDTPTKQHHASPSLRRRLASKSMHDLSAAGSYHTPSRAMSASNDNLRAAALAQQQHQSQYAIPPQRSPSLHSLHSPTASDFAPPVPQIPPHSRHLSSPALPVSSIPMTHTLSAPSSVMVSSPSLPNYTHTYASEDDVPSPFLKKPAHSAPAGRLPTSSSTSTITAKPSKPPLLTRLLTTRAGAAVSGGGGGDVPQRRVSIAPKRPIGV
ncbi:hypothetical protein JCM11251_000487 [Rhodosporidiobolus azoricus]